MLLEELAEERKRREIQFVADLADGLLRVEQVMRDGFDGGFGDPVERGAGASLASGRGSDEYLRRNNPPTHPVQNH